MPYRVFCLAFLLVMPTAVKADESHFYTVMKDRQPIGVQSYTFRERGSDLQVEAKWDVKIDLAGFTVYQYQHQRVEQWKNGQIVEFKGWTKDDGTDFAVALERTKDGYDWRVNGQVRSFDGAVMPATSWNAAILEHRALISPVDKDYQQVEVASHGRERVRTGIGTILAERFSILGDVRRDVWYDAEGRLVKLSFQKHGSEVEVVLDRVISDVDYAACGQPAPMQQVASVC